jgi:hypothetical protein
MNYLNRFTQPDSIVPNPSNSQDWDRYSYVRNNPIRFIDPTGHVAEKALYFEGDGPLPLASYGVFVEDGLSSDVLLAVGKVVRDIAKALSAVTGNDTVSSFKEAFGGNVGVSRWSTDQCGCAADVWQNNGRWEIRIFDSDWTIAHPDVLVHEFGHIYYHLHREEFTKMGSRLRRPDYGGIENGYYGFSGGRFEGQFAIENLDGDNEIFADMFLGWVYGSWTLNAPGLPGEARRLWMNVNMSGSYYGNLGDER